MADQNLFRYQHFTIFKDQVLGRGSYGAVYKARCDQLTCAAKVLHPTIVDPYDPGAEKILQRFQQECDFLNLIRHPHIVQYLGVCQDPESKLPVLLMELLDSSLTKMLESSPHPIPYHIQVDLCSDVSLAVAYLHSNEIIHRDLSGNNVLVIAGRRAKVTDFGMSKLSRSEHNFTPLTMCPGTRAYMSPESLTEPPRYTEKLDVFSQGVIMIQVCTRQFPDPGPSMEKKDDPQSPTGTVQVPVLEPDRRKQHIDMIDPTHPMFPIALSCLEYREMDRPSAEELSQSLRTLRENQEYTESSKHTTLSTYETLKLERDDLAKQVKDEIRENAFKDGQISAQEQEIRALSLDLSTKNELIVKNDHEIEQLRIQLHELNQKLEENEQITALFQDSNKGLQKKISDLQKKKDQSQPPITPQPIELRLKWNSFGDKAPFESYRQGMVVEGSLVYITVNKKLYSFDSSIKEWDTSLPDCIYEYGSIAIIQGLLTTIGGWISSDKKPTNELVSLTKKEKGGIWNTKFPNFPPMPTPRTNTTATTYQCRLIVAGGSTTLDSTKAMDTVEVLNTYTSSWSTASSLPSPLAFGSATVCGAFLYMLGGNSTSGPCQSAFSCSLSDLIQSCEIKTSSPLDSLKKLTSKFNLFHGSSQPQVWQSIADIPMLQSTCATVCGQLIAVGGYVAGDQNQKSTAIYQYDQNTNSWNIISHLTIARSSCIVAVTDRNEMIVVGGFENIDTHTNRMEIASFLL